MAVDRDRVRRALTNLDGERALRNLLGRVLGYEYEGGRISDDSWPEELDGDPMLFATAGREGRFPVIYARLNTPGRLSLMVERKVMEQLRNRYPYALYAFSDREDRLWHFVNAPHAERVGEKQYRRIVVGPGEPSRTAIERVSMLSVDDLSEKRRVDPDELSPLDIQDLHDEAFDVEEVTKRFFQKYEQVFKNVEAGLTGITRKEDVRYFTQRLLNRLMFVAFIEKKGWLSLNGKTDYLHSLLSAYKGDRDRNGSFYTSRLKTLFFRGFNSENREDEEDRIIGTVPYLNGGLFEEDRYDTDERVDVPDECFDEIVHRLFGGFNFTTTESTPLDVEVAVDPEMLGRVFEELVTGRHETGSYYTPKPIVSFMCREAIKGHLGAKLPDDTVEDVNVFVDDHDPSGLHNPEAVLTALQEFTVCDPACGSGAYLLGMLHELLDLRASLFAAHNLDARSTYDRKLQIIQRNLYGVDIDPFAVNIARLRLWLSLVVDYDGDDPPPLPNLDFKIESGDSLTAPDPSGGIQLDLIRNGQISELLELKDEYLRSHHERKKELREHIEDLRSEIAEYVHRNGEVSGFDWQVEFAEIFAGNGGAGFDAVLANPPYVRMELFKPMKPMLRKNFPEAHSDRADLYVYFYARALQLLKVGGMLSFISSNKWFRAGYGKNLRAHIADTCHVSSITDFGELPVFQAAATFPMIFAAQKGRNEIGGPTSFTQVKSLAPPYPDVAALIWEQGSPLPDDSITGSDWTLTDATTADRLKKMRASGIPLGEYAQGQIYYGIKTGLNKAFVIDGAKREELISQDPKSATMIKPLLVGDNIRKWRIESKDKWLLYMHHGIDVSEVPHLVDYLRPYRERLERRATQQEWYELQQPQMRYASGFGEPKIVFPDIAKHPRFAFDATGAYLSNTGYTVLIDDLYLLGVLNSSLTWEFAKATFPCLGDPERGGRFRFIYGPVSKVPIPNASTRDRDTIADLVKKCLDARGVGCEEFEREIDERVASLYGLSSQDLGDREAS